MLLRSVSDAAQEHICESDNELLAFLRGQPSVVVLAEEGIVIA